MLPSLSSTCAITEFFLWMVSIDSGIAFVMNFLDAWKMADQHISLDSPSPPRSGGSLDTDQIISSFRKR